MFTLPLTGWRGVVVCLRTPTPRKIKMQTTYQSNIPDFPNYHLTPDGEVIRVRPAARGLTAGKKDLRVNHTIHPKGYQWYVLLTDFAGKRRRVKLKDLMYEVYGETVTRFGEYGQLGKPPENNDGLL